MTDDLVARLLEAIAETERIARSAQHPDAPDAGEHWQWEYPEQECPLVDTPVDMNAPGTHLGDGVEFGWRVSLRSAERYQRLPEGQPIGGPELPHIVFDAEEVPMGASRHVIAHDPASVLRRCAADRRRLQRHAPTEPGIGHFDSSRFKGADTRICAHCSHDGDWGATVWPCPDVDDLAASYGLEVTG